MGKPKEKNSVTHKILTIIGTILCIILIPILVMNVTLIIKSYTNKDEVPSIGGYLPLIVLTDSMYPEIKSGDLIICHTVEPEEVNVGDVIAFFDPAGNGTSIVTHRVVEVVETDGQLVYRTRGDANNVDDAKPVSADNLVGEYRHRIGGMGNVAMFMQTTAGLIVCVVVPILLLIGYDVIRNRTYQKKKEESTEALLEELAALRAEKAAKEKEEQSSNK